MKKMILVLSLITVLLVNFNCTTKKEYYHGYVYDTKEKPIPDVTVSEIDNFLSTRTDTLGYFKLKRTTAVTKFIFFKEGYKTDTVPTVWLQHGEFEMHMFSNKKPDTLYLYPLK